MLYTLHDGRLYAPLPQDIVLQRRLVEQRAYRELLTWVRVRVRVGVRVRARVRVRVRVRRIANCSRKSAR